MHQSMHVYPGRISHRKCVKERESSALRSQVHQLCPFDAPIGVRHAVIPFQTSCTFMDIIACKESVKKFVKSTLLMNREIRGDCAVLGRNEAVGHVMTFWTSATSQLNPLTVSFLAFTMVFPSTKRRCLGPRRHSVRVNTIAVFQCESHGIEGNKLEFCSLLERLYSTV